MAGRTKLAPWQKAGMTPTQRTLALLRSWHLAPVKVERWNAHAGGGMGVRQDMLGCIDILALGRRRVVAVQSCGTAFSDHYRKIIGECCEKVALWLATGSPMVLIGWRDLKAATGPKTRLPQPRIRRITIDDLLGLNDSRGL